MEVAGLALLEVALLVAVYQLGPSFDCAQSGSFGACRMVSDLMLRGASVVVALALYLAARRVEVALVRGRWPLVHAAGFVLVLVPAFLPVSDFATLFRIGLLPWLAGGLLAGLGALLWLLPAAEWRRLAERDGTALSLVLSLGFIAPTLLALVDPGWNWPPLAKATFLGVARTLAPFGEVELDFANHVIGLDGFHVQVGPACSGIQGFALIVALLLGYFHLARTDLRFPHAWLLLPIGLAASFALNVVRIAVLVLIGTRISPELAVTAFHSNAGWLMFAVIALALLAASRAVPLFHAPVVATPRRVPPLLRDANAALILPVTTFLLTGVAIAAFTTVPGFWLPVQGGLAALVLLVYAPLLRRAMAGPGLLATGAGLLVGAAWIATRPAPPEADGLATLLAGLPPAGLAVWVGLRLLTTAIVMPVVEEAFFRGYVLSRLDRGGAAMRAVALLVSAGIFGLLHERWLAAAAAGLVFGLLYLARGRLGDAVAAHAAANLVIGAWALAQGEWSVI